jgi:hypothetical protein
VVAVVARAVARRLALPEPRVPQPCKVLAVLAVVPVLTELLAVLVVVVVRKLALELRVPRPVAVAVVQVILPAATVMAVMVLTARFTCHGTLVRAAVTSQASRIRLIFLRQLMAQTLRPSSRHGGRWTQRRQ